MYLKSNNKTLCPWELELVCFFYFTSSMCANIIQPGKVAETLNKNKHDFFLCTCITNVLRITDPTHKKKHTLKILNLTYFYYMMIIFFLAMLYLDIYRLMLSDKKYGLSVNLMATRVMPSLLPQTINPSLNLEQFTILLEVFLPSVFRVCVFFISFDINY